VLSIFVRAVRADLRRQSPGASGDAELAAVSFAQRFGSSLNPHFHVHVLVVDGVFCEATPEGVLRCDIPAHGRSPRIAWAQLIARIYEVLPLLCPACGGEMRIVAFPTDPPVVRSILLHLGLPDRPPLIAPARAPPQAELDFDPTSGFGPADGDPGPDFDFDQSLPEELDV
jgi:hypothetical protein